MTSPGVAPNRACARVQVMKQAADYLRLSHVRSRGQWEQGEECRTVCCVELAARKFNVAIGWCFQ